MDRAFFMKTERTVFSLWQAEDLPLAMQLWGDGQVTCWICASGVFTAEDVAARLRTEVSNGETYGLQYWPVFHRETGDLVGCCGLRPRAEDEYEIGFHLRPAYWRQGYAAECARAVIDYAFSKLEAKKLFAGHNPNNAASAKVLGKLGFAYIGDEFYAPTGLNHPSYELLP